MGYDWNRRFKVVPINECEFGKGQPHSADFVVTDKFTDRKFKCCSRHLSLAKDRLKELENE